MNLVADESVDEPIILRLRLEGHDVVAIAELSPSVNDDAVLHEANTRGALLVTADKDFGELVYRLGRAHHGVVLLRLSGLSPELKADLVADAFQNHGGEFTGAFAVISPGSLRIRR
jgi:predicted nuclease of predicted toxin-antitoxin system